MLALTYLQKHRAFKCLLILLEQILEIVQKLA